MIGEDHRVQTDLLTDGPSLLTDMAETKIFVF